MNSKTAILKAALNYNQRGFSTIPCKPNKKARVKWEGFQKRRATPEEIRNWWTKWPNDMIGIVTGSISGIDVVDTDNQEADEELQSFLPDSLRCPIQRTPGGGKHYVFAHAEGIRNSNDRSAFKFHVRGEGGYFIVAPSENGTAGRYEWLDGLSIEKVAPPPMPDALYKELINSFVVGGYRGVDVNADNGDFNRLQPTSFDFKEGSRDNTLFHIANHLVKGGMPENEVLLLIEILAKKCCNPPFPINEAREKIRSALNRAERKVKSIAEQVREFIVTSSGFFLTSECFNRLQVTSREDKKAVVLALLRFKKDGLIERHGDKNGCYRRVENECEEINFLNASSQTIDIKWPLGIERYIITLPKNVMVIAGSKDAGKTAYLLNMVRLNMDRFLIHYFISEMGGIEFRKRLEKFNYPLETWKFKAKERSNNFADVIQPNDINIIDYLEVSEDFYRVGGMLTEIYKKLNQGIAIVALQKNTGRDTGVGGDRSLEKPRLYLSLENGKAKIIVGKNWASDINPVGLQLDFKLAQGSEFTIDKNWHK